MDSSILLGRKRAKDGLWYSWVWVWWQAVEDLTFGFSFFFFFFVFLKPPLDFLFFFFFCLFKAAPSAYGGSQARGRIGAVATSLQPQPQQHRIRTASATYPTAHSNAESLTHWVRPGIMDASHNHLHWTTTELLGFLYETLCVKCWGWMEK